MDKFDEIKKNHHYVWSFYLKNWSLDKKNIYYISKKGKISFDSVKGLAKEIDFYKINSLNQNDIKFLKNLSSKSSLEAQKLHMSQLNFFIRLLKIEEDLSDFKVHDEREKIVNTIKSNSLENTYMIIEKLALEVISNLSKKDLKILEEKQKLLALLYYLGHQITRTKSFRDRVLSEIKKDDRLYNYWEKNWWFISYMFGMNIGYSFYTSILNKKTKYFIFENKTKYTFITSDNPVINIHPSLNELKEREAPEHADFYIAISPNIGLMINESSFYDYMIDEVKDEDVMFLNRKLYEKSHETIFAKSENIIKEVKSYVG